MPRSRYEVPTRVLVRQGEVVARTARTVAAAPELVAGFAPLAVDLSAFALEVRGQAKQVEGLDQAQESLKGDTSNEQAEARQIATAGHGWVGRLHNRLNRAIARGFEGSHRYRSAFRLGQRRADNPSSVKVDLLNAVHELRRLPATLSAFGIDAAFRAEGEALLDRLAKELDEADDALQRRMSASAALAEAQDVLVGLLQDWLASVDGAQDEVGHPLNIRRLDVLDRYVAAAAEHGEEAALAAFDAEPPELADGGAPGSDAPLEADVLGADALAALTARRTITT